MTLYKNLHGTLVEEPTTSMHPGPKMNVPCPVGPQILPFHKSEFPRKLCRSVIHIMQPSVNQTEKFIKIPIRGPWYKITVPRWSPHEEALGRRVANSPTNALSIYETGGCQPVKDVLLPPSQILR